MSSPENDQVYASSTSPRDWKYVSEGGATIVFSYRGPPHPTFSGTVLRLRKVHRGLNSDASSRSASVLSEGEEAEPDDPSILFQQKVTSQLIDPAFLPHLETVLVERAWLEFLKASSEEDRPLKRRNLDEIDVSRRKAVLATDLVGGEGWAVEIKPKWGFLPNPEYLSPETREIKSRHCHFCMHTHFKSERDENASSGYCPLDLFSGNTERVSHALRCLWRAWITSDGTVNNLKIFSRGELVVPKEAKSEKLGSFLQGSANGSEEDSLMAQFVEALLPLLTETPVLRNIAHLQRTLDPLDIEGLQSLHAASPTSETSIEYLYPDPSLDDWERFVGRYKSQRSITDVNPGLLQHYVMAYLLSATFKDCSIMLHFGRGEKGSGTITVIDLDPKSMKRLKKWADLDREIVTLFRDDGTRFCLDELSAMRERKR